jgi:hypothetical protein
VRIEMLLSRQYSTTESRFRNSLALSKVVDLPESMRFSLFVVDDGYSGPAAIKCSLHTSITSAKSRSSTLPVTLVISGRLPLAWSNYAAVRESTPFSSWIPTARTARLDILRMLEEATRRPGHIIYAMRKHRPGLVAFPRLVRIVQCLFSAC